MLGWQPNYPLEGALGETIAWYGEFLASVEPRPLHLFELQRVQPAA
jgi:hypothetical protein